MCVRRFALGAPKRVLIHSDLRSQLQPTVGGDQRVASGSRTDERAPSRRPSLGTSATVSSSAPIRRQVLRRAAPSTRLAPGHAETSLTTGLVDPAAHGNARRACRHSTVRVPAISTSRTITRRRPFPGRPGTAVRTPTPEPASSGPPALTVPTQRRHHGEAVHAHERHSAQPIVGLLAHVGGVLTC